MVNGFFSRVPTALIALVSGHEKRQRAKIPFHGFAAVTRLSVGHSPTFLRTIQLGSNLLHNKFPLCAAQQFPGFGILHKVKYQTPGEELGTKFRPGGP